MHGIALVHSFFAASINYKHPELGEGNTKHSGTFLDLSQYGTVLEEAITSNRR
jgi:hypothetical protein